MLPLIAIYSKISGVIYINNQYLGEVDSANFQNLFLSKTTVLTFTPINNSKDIYSNITFKLSFVDNRVTSSSPFVIITNYGKNTFCVEIKPEKLASFSLPHCIAYKKLNNYVVSLMKHNNYYLVMEDTSNNTGDCFFPIGFTRDTISVDTLDNKIILCDTNMLYVLSTKGILLSMNATSYAINDNKIIITQTTTYGHKVTLTYNNNLEITSKEYSINPNAKADIVFDFLECIKYDIEKRCLSLLSNDLQNSLSYIELKEFIGSFDEIQKSPFNNDVYCLITKDTSRHYTVKQFTFAIKEGRIYDIENT